MFSLIFGWLGLRGYWYQYQHHGAFNNFIGDKKIHANFVQIRYCSLFEGVAWLVLEDIDACNYFQVVVQWAGGQGGIPNSQLKSNTWTLDNDDD